MQSPTHVECSSIFSFPRNRNQYIFFEPCEVPAVFPYFSFSCKGSFFFGQSLKRLSGRLRCEHRRFHMNTLVGLVSYALADRVANFSHSKRVFSRNPMRDLPESRYKTSQAYFRLPRSRLQAPFKRTYAHDTRPFSNCTPPSQLRTN